jgi:tripartite-type tricarboxylate transporter receptor subunit TctC
VAKLKIKDLETRISKDEPRAKKAAPADGYTLLLATPTVEARPRFDPTRDALPITMVARTSVVLSTKADGPLNSVAAFVAAAKQSPGKVTFGTTGAGSINQLAGEWLAADAGLKMLHVPYRGGGPAAKRSSPATLRQRS